MRGWGEWRGFAQLREGSDDPPPPVRIGASAALADATPKPVSRPSRTVVIANVRRRRETRYMKPNPLPTPNGTNTIRLCKLLPAGKPLGLPTPALHPIARTNCESQPSPRHPYFHHTTPHINNTQGHMRGRADTTRPRLLLFARGGVSSLNRQVGISRCSAGRRRLPKRCRGSGR